MKVRTILLAPALCFLLGTVGFAANANLGTWKLNDAKSKFAPGAPKNNTVAYETAGDSIKVTVDGINADGSSVHSEWTGQFDSKDYPVTGDPTEDMRSYTKIDDHTLQITIKKDGKVIIKGRIVVSADGKSRTFTSFSTDPNGKKVKSVAVYDKQ